MSRESQAIFTAAVEAFEPGHDPARLRSAAAGHLGASRGLAELTRLYAIALSIGNHEQAQQLADELVPVRQAERVMAGGVPGSGG